MINEEGFLASKVTPIEKGFEALKKKVLADIEEYEEAEAYFRVAYDLIAAERMATKIRGAKKYLAQLDENKSTIEEYKKFKEGL